MEEIAALSGQGLPVPDKVATRLREHLDQALQEAAKLDDAALLQLMEQIQVRSQEQIQLLEKLRENAPDKPEEALELATQAMNNLRAAAEDALEDPVTFKLHQGTNRPADAPDLLDMDLLNGESQGPGNKGAGRKGSGNQDTTTTP